LCVLLKRSELLAADVSANFGCWIGEHELCLLTAP